MTNHPVCVSFHITLSSILCVVKNYFFLGFLCPSDFPNTYGDAYFMYVRYHVVIGMQVRCCRGSLQLEEGDTGVVMKLDKDNLLRGLNVKVLLHFIL